MNKVKRTAVVTVLLAILLVGCGDKTTNMSQESDDIRLYGHEFIEKESTEAEETAENAASNKEKEDVTYPLYSTRSDNKIVNSDISDMAVISYSLLDKAILYQNEDAWYVTCGDFEMSEFNRIVKECERYADYFDLKLSALMKDDDTFYVIFRKDYCVKRGDTLSKIASKYGVTVEYIINLNSDVISNPDELEAGTLLRLY